MNKRTLGRTGLDVSELALGGLFVSSHFHNDEDAAAKKAVRHAVDAGINYIDTAPSYGNSEEVLGKCLEGIDAPLIISTKLGGRPKPFDPKDKKVLRESVQTSLKLLGRDVIDILMVHEPERPRQYEWWDDEVEFVGPVTEILDELKKEGIIRFTGLGGTTAYEMPHIMATEKFDVVLTAFNYSLLWREAEHEVLPMAKAKNMGVVIGSPLQQGALARRADDVIDNARWLSSPRRAQFKALYKFCDELGCHIADLAMRFVISNPDITCVLTGARSAEEVQLNIDSVARGPLPADVLKRLDEIAAMVPFRPYEEPFGLNFWNTGMNRPGQAGR